MFNLFKKKTHEFTVTAPLTGKLINLTEVPDPVFSQKLMGDGFAIIPDSKTTKIYAPVSAKIVSLPESKHAVGLVTDDQDEVLLHIGIDTVNLKGQGFTALVNEGDSVTQGQAVIELDREVLESKQANLTTMVIFTKLSSDHQQWQLAEEYGSKVKSNDLLVTQ
ncbi:PTS glucose transporter subunit IIA [Lactobacillus sp. ESL0684]|uniref:PTS sugar transporter subunit IIA n=1 Tax=Lactobacillus sp. ESL0684 TaxID=2983213 RepID=UPI0023F7E631|nr:PTS glucose transporter subunit IIA [Lactobacillus sp. ESL0684]WEV43462.1 PTS glucose transporter subunit IIA [Lactobacillus sp. ESL0684]